MDETRPRRYEGEVPDFVERFAADLTEAGMPRMSARVFACLLAEDSGQLSSAELAERLRASPAAISGAVRYLSQIHMVGREREPGSRRERYRVRADIWYEAFTGRDKELSRWESTLKSGVDVLGPETEAGRRLAETADFFEFMQSELATLMDRWRARRAGS
ncbi:GbsR/MarR family transcriptional regulator [Streptomyces physcomitrii]|uniref:GbsR/MarR family transcriptional regulator n=1 Tax=Streptomyces physcomitrii TaxID=2724184 RepID=UPI0035E41015